MGSVGKHLRGNVVAYVALFFALGGSAYAVTALDRNSVKSKHIVNGQIKSADVKNNGLTASDINEPSLGGVPTTTLFDEVDAEETTSSFSPVDLATGGPEVTVNVEEDQLVSVLAHVELGSVDPTVGDARIEAIAHLVIDGEPQRSMASEGALRRVYTVSQVGAGSFSGTSASGSWRTYALEPGPHTFALRYSCEEISGAFDVTACEGEAERAVFRNRRIWVHLIHAT